MPVPTELSFTGAESLASQALHFLLKLSASAWELGASLQSCPHQLTCAAHPADIQSRSNVTFSEFEKL